MPRIQGGDTLDAIALVVIENLHKVIAQQVQIDLVAIVADSHHESAARRYIPDLHGQRLHEKLLHFFHPLKIRRLLLDFKWPFAFSESLTGSPYADTVHPKN